MTDVKPQTYLDIEHSSDYGKTWRTVTVSSRSPLAAYRNDGHWPHDDGTGNVYRDVQEETRHA